MRPIVDVFKKIFPIQRRELAKFISLSLLMFSILFIQNLVRGMKDGIVVVLIGPEIINFIKLWLIPPTGFLFLLIYFKISAYFNTEKAFRCVIYFFIIYFLFFSFYIFPNYESIHLNLNTIDDYIKLYPRIKWILLSFSNWGLVSFYIIGELWFVVVFLLLFWQLANKITHVNQSTRFYPLFSLLGQISLLVSGAVLAYLTSNTIEVYTYSNNDTIISIQSIGVTIGIAGIVCLLAHRFIEKKIISNSSELSPGLNTAKPKMRLIDSLKISMSSRYLQMISLTLIFYTTSVILIEGLWMAKVKEFYPSPHLFINYHGQVLFYTGLCTIICSLLGNYIISSFGWKVAAVLTPIGIMVAGGIFFIFALFEGGINQLLLNFDIECSALYILILVGGVQNVLGKGIKYSLFDSTKEMLFIPLDEEMKTKGKAAAELVAANLGQFVGVMIQFAIFTIFPYASYSDIIPILLIAFLITCILWFYNTKALSIEYSNLLKDNTN